MDFRQLLQPASHSWSANTAFHFPDDEAFPAITERWTIAFPPSFAASITPAVVEDVQIAVDIAIRNSIPFMATSGKHGYCSKLNEMQQVLQIDLSALNEIHVNAGADTVTVGPGVQFKDVFDPLFNTGKEMTVGICSSVSVIGATLGTGVGRYQALHGLLIDNLISARVVTASGSLVTASNSENADLFWALRGAGVFFGVVVEATYRIHDLTSGGQCQNADLVFPLAAVERFMKAIKVLDDEGKVPSKLLVTVVFA